MSFTMEALSFGIPCIATDVGGTKEIVIDGYNGWLLKKDFKEEQLVNIIRNYCNLNNEQILKLRECAYESSILFRITYIFAILKVLESAIYVSYAGYLSMYTSFSSNLPYIIQKLAELSPILMFTWDLHI